jgi:AraC-like DNA-binding protein
MLKEDIDSKDCANSYTNEAGWAVLSLECEYEAWTTENRFKRVYHLAPCEDILVCKLEEEALDLALRLNGRVAPVGFTASNYN